MYFIMLSECYSNVVLCIEIKQGVGDGQVVRFFRMDYIILGNRFWKYYSDL